MIDTIKTVFPAHAGMSLGQWIKIWSGNRFPRACGDEPELASVLGAQLKFSPRMRG